MTDIDHVSGASPANATAPWVEPRDLVVTSRRDAADGVVELVVALPDSAPLPAWQAGAHVDVLMGENLQRQYSLCGSPQDSRHWRIAVLKEDPGRGGSHWMHSSVRVGSTLRVRGPRNHFALVDSPRYLFIAGGIGITPILPMMAQASAAGAQWQLFYGGRSRSSMAYVDTLAKYEGRVHLWPADTLGLLDLGAILGEPQGDTAVYCCGPEALLLAVENYMGAWPAHCLHTERFSPRAVLSSAEPDTSFEVVLQASGQIIVVPPGRSILEVAQEAGADVAYSCTEGMCGSCETKVLGGTPDHRDSVLDEDERATADVMMICVSRSQGLRLILDL